MKSAGSGVVHSGDQPRAGPAAVESGLDRSSTGKRSRSLRAEPPSRWATTGPSGSIPEGRRGEALKPPVRLWRARLRPGSRLACPGGLRQSCCKLIDARRLDPGAPLERQESGLGFVRVPEALPSAKREGLTAEAAGADCCCSKLALKWDWRERQGLMNSSPLEQLQGQKRAEIPDLPGSRQRPAPKLVLSKTQAFDRSQQCDTSRLPVARGRDRLIGNRLGSNGLAFGTGEPGSGRLRWKGWGRVWRVEKELRKGSGQEKAFDHKRFQGTTHHQDRDLF